MGVPQVLTAFVPKEAARVVTPVAGVLMRALLVGMSSSLLPVIVTFTVILWTGQLSGSVGVTVGALSIVVTCPMVMCYNAMLPVLSTGLSILEMTGKQSVDRAQRNANVGEKVRRRVDLRDLLYCVT